MRYGAWLCLWTTVVSNTQVSLICDTIKTVIKAIWNWNFLVKCVVGLRNTSLTSKNKMKDISSGKKRVLYLLYKFWPQYLLIYFAKGCTCWNLASGSVTPEQASLTDANRSVRLPLLWEEERELPPENFASCLIACMYLNPALRQRGTICRYRIHTFIPDWSTPSILPRQLARLLR